MKWKRTDKQTDEVKKHSLLSDILLSPFIFFLFFDDFNIFVTVADSYNGRIDSCNYHRQLKHANQQL